MWRTAVALLLVGPSFVLLVAAPASGAEIISIPVDLVIYGYEGDEVLVAGADIPPELVGESCEMTGETYNQDSIHEGNDLLIDLGDQVRVLPDFEDERDIRHTFRGIEELPERIDVYVRLGPDGVSSGGFLISIECDDVATTTSTSTTTTSTTTTSTTTTIASTTIPATTIPATTIPATTVSPSSTAPTTTFEISGPTSTSTTVPPGFVTQEDPPPGQLAVTGASTAALAAIGLGLVALGGVILGQGTRARSRA